MGPSQFKLHVYGQTQNWLPGKIKTGLSMLILTRTINHTYDTCTCKNVDSKINASYLFIQEFLFYRKFTSTINITLKC